MSLKSYVLLPNKNHKGFEKSIFGYTFCLNDPEDYGFPSIQQIDVDGDGLKDNVFIPKSGFGGASLNDFKEYVALSLIQNGSIGNEIINFINVNNLHIKSPTGAQYYDNGSNSWIWDSTLKAKLWPFNLDLKTAIKMLSNIEDEGGIYTWHELTPDPSFNKEFLFIQKNY